jgi:subtilisin-like proprotein convertase family protein
MKWYSRIKKRQRRLSADFEEVMNKDGVIMQNRFLKRGSKTLKKVFRRNLLVVIGLFTIGFVSVMQSKAQVLPQVGSIGGNLGTAPLGGETGILSTRIQRNGTATATCSGITPPSPFNSTPSGTYRYNVHYLKNPTIFAICVPVKLSIFPSSPPNTDLHLAVFQAPFTAADITNSTRFRGDAGYSTAQARDDSGTTYLNVVVPGNSSVALVVYNSNPIPQADGATYRINFNSKRFSYTGSPVQIPDNTPGGANATVNVSGIGQNISDVNLLLEEGSGTCDETQGNTNAAITHSFLGDLIVKLQSPTGINVTLVDRIGVPASSLGNQGNNFCSTIFDQSISPAGGIPNIENFTGQPIRGYFYPQVSSFQNLNSFIGSNPSGIWTMNVSDNSSLDTGSINRFTVEVTSTPIRVPFDIDGDGKSDKTVFRPSNGVWYFDYSSPTSFGLTSRSFGTLGDNAIPADYSGDGQMDFAVFRPSNNTWYISDSQSGIFTARQFGTAGDLPIPGDFDGDRKADISVFRPSTGVWYRFNSGNQQFVAIQFGLNSDIPVIGDFDGDLRDDIALFRPSNGIWYRLNSSNGSLSAVQFGQSGDKVVPADYTGDGITDIAVWRPSTGFWYVLRSDDSSFYGYQFGVSTDLPTPADYDGDGETDIAVFRPSNGSWYFQNSTSGFLVEQWGTSGDRPAQNSFVR